MPRTRSGIRKADITEADIQEVSDAWEHIMAEQDAGDVADLVHVLSAPWHLFEGEQHLIEAACVHLGMKAPLSVTFSCLDSIEVACECEVILFWPTTAGKSLDPGRFVRGTSIRISEFAWPGTDMVVKRDEHIRYVIWCMSLLKKEAKKEGLCI